MKATYPELASAVEALLSVCDGAHTLDGQGFNGYDAAFVRDLMDQGPDRWTAKQAAAVHRTLRKYRVQLAGFGITYEAIPAPTPPPAPVAQKRAARADIVNGKLALQFSYDAALVSRIKQDLQGRRWDPAGRRWLVDLTTRNAPALSALLADFDLGEGVEAALAPLCAQGAAEADLRARGEAESAATSATLDVPGLRGALMPFQAAGVRYALDRRRVLIGDEMGLGKTIQALAAVQAVNAYPALIVCPATLKPNWQREAQRWLPESVSVGLVNGGRQEAVIEEADVVVINYDILGKHLDAIRGRTWRALVVDEAHYAKNHKALRTKAVKAVAKAVEPNGLVLLLTGTPIVNRPQELTTLIDLLGRLPEFGGFWAWLRRVGVERGRFGLEFNGTPAQLEDANRALRQTCLVRRLKADVLADLPEKRRATIPIRLSPEASAAYQEVLDDYREALDIAREAGGEGGGAVHLTYIEKLKQAAARGKLDACCEWINDVLETGEKLVVFAHHQEIQRALLDRYPDAARVVADDSVAVRDVQVQRFQSDPACRLIVVSLKAGGVGITLTAASNVAFLELGWTPGDHDQAEDRCHRIGQRDAVTAWYLLAAGTIEEEIADLIERKRLVVNALSQGVAQADTAGSILGDLIERLTGRLAAE